MTPTMVWHLDVVMGLSAMKTRKISKIYRRGKPSAEQLSMSTHGTLGQSNVLRFQF